jgi:hypothetical protein
MMSTPKRISPRKLAANRRNAQRSTGPNTPDGQGHSRGNAFKHGMTAKQVVVDTGDGREDKEEFLQMLAGMHDYFKPIGVPQEMLVNEIAIGFLKKQRAHRFEVGAIREHADTVRGDYESDEVHALQNLLEKIEDVKAELKCTNALSVKSRAWLKTQFGLSYSADPGGETAAHDASTPAYASEDVAKQLWADLAAETEQLLRRETSALEREKLHRDAAAKRAALPDEQRLGVLLRYQAANDKQLQRALDQLAQLQRQRQPPDAEGTGGAGVQ